MEKGTLYNITKMYYLFLTQFSVQLESNEAKTAENNKVRLTFYKVSPRCTIR